MHQESEEGRVARETPHRDEQRGSSILAEGNDILNATNQKTRKGREEKGRKKSGKRWQYVQASKSVRSEQASAHKAGAHGALLTAQPAVLGPNSMARGRPAAETWDGIIAVSRNETQCALAEPRELKPSSPSSSSKKHAPSSMEMAAV